ncbi:hypothetical protein EMPS_10843 [Entomortierella parvispora]|uniref:SAP domain-containing protein n=1 Tax=Entomortierella parvispora TaxID=205924 RepID=A0A9P3HKJ2_9FUNG|nr:hypothetical protein EMPS_10843 [Entomortierella parvispora]
MYYTNLRRLSVLQGPRSLLNRSRRFSVQTGAIQPMSLSKRSALRMPTYSPQELHAMSSADLKSLMKENGLRYAGEKSTLVDRATRYVYQNPTVSTSSSSRLHPHLSSKGQRATVQRKPATTASSVSKKSSSTRKPSAQRAQMKEIPHQEIFGHDHDFGTKLAARAHFEGSSLSWAAPAPAPPVPQPNMFSAAQKSTVASIKAKHAAALSKSTTTKTSTPAAHLANHSSASPAKVKEAPMTTVKAAAHHADHSAKPTAQQNATITASKSKINAVAEAKEGYQTKISSFHLATMPKEGEVKSGAGALNKVEIKSGATTPSKVADSTRTTIRSAAAALLREKTTTSPSSPMSIFDLPKVAQPHLEKQIFQASESAPKTSVSKTFSSLAPKKTVQPPASTSATHTKPVMSEKATAASTGGASTGAKVSSSSSGSSGGMGRNEIKQTSPSEASSSSSTPSKSSSSASSSESKAGPSSSSSSNKKAESSDGWSSDKIPTSTSAFPALLGLGVIAWFIAGKRDRFLQAEARKREEERRLHAKRRMQINESAEEVVLL